MTVTQYSAHLLLLLLIALATITLGTQPVRRDASEGDSTSTGGCISDWIGLNKAYLERQSSADVENSIFDFYPSHAINYSVLVMFYDMGPPPNTSTSGRRECCQRGNKDCIIFFIYRFKIFRDFHPELIRNFALLTPHVRNLTGNLKQLCWAPPRVCQQPNKIMKEFSDQVMCEVHTPHIIHAVTHACSLTLKPSLCLVQFLGTMLQDSPWHNDIFADVHNLDDSYRPNPRLPIHLIPIQLFLMAGLLLVLYMHHRWGVAGTVMAQSQVARHTVRSAMLTLWGMFLWMMAQYYIVIKAMDNAIKEERVFRQIQDIYSEQVILSKAQFGSFLAILLLEAPFLCVFFLRKATELHNRRQQLSKTDCRLCYWFTVLCDTLGGIGVVAAVQIASVYLFYCGLMFIVSPVYIIVQLSLKLAYIGTTLFVTFVFIQIVSTCFSTCFRKKCSPAGVVKGVVIFLLLLLNITINDSFRSLQPFEDNSSDDTLHAVLRSLVSSVLIGICGYVARRTLYQRMKKEVESAEEKHPELEPLVQKGIDTRS